MKIKKLLGYILMIVACSILLFLSASMTLDMFSQKRKHEEFVKIYEKRDEKEKESAKKKSILYNKNLDGDNLSVDPFLSEGYKSSYDILSKDDDVFGYITVPSIDVSQPIYLGASDEHLVKGFAHVDGTSLPIGGLGERSVIAGHRGGYYGRLDLLYADRIKKGDLLRIDLGNEILEYEMVSREIIHPSEWEKLKSIEDKDMVTLLTCDPFPTAENRMLVNFERVEDSSDKISDNRSRDRSEISHGDSINEKKNKDISSARSSFFEENSNRINIIKHILTILSIFLIIIIIIIVKRIIIYVKNM